MKELQNLVAVIFTALTLLTAGCATPSFHPGNVMASEKDIQQVKAGKWNRSASAQFVLGRIDPKTGERVKLEPKDVTVVLQTAITCQEDAALALPGPGQSVFRGAAEGGVVNGAATAIGYDGAYTRQILPNKSNFTLGAHLGLAIGGFTGAYNGYARGAYDRAKAVVDCLRQVNAQNKERPVGMYFMENPNGKAADAQTPLSVQMGGMKEE